MSIHNERVATDLKDRQLLGRLLAFAAPYWRPIALCLLLAVVIVAADLARPYLLKLAIDDHINGLNLPMAAAPADNRAVLEGNAREIEWNGDVYVRLSAEDPLPSGAIKRQIVERDGKRYMIEGWLPAKSDQVSVVSDGGNTVIVADGTRYPATELGADDVARFRSGDDTAFIRLGLVFLVAIVASALFGYWQSNLLQFTGLHIIFHIREKLFHQLTRMSMSYFDRNPVGRIVTRVTQDTEALNQLYSQVVVNLVKDVITVIGIIVIMLQMSGKLSLLAFAVLPVLALLTFAYRRIIRDAQRNVRLLLSRLNAFLAENLSGIRITQLFIREQRQSEQFEEHNERYYRAGMLSTVVNSIFQPAIAFLGNVAIALLLWYGGIRVIDGALTFGVVYAFTHYTRQFFQPMQSLAEKYNQIQTAMVGAERIFDTLDEQPAIVDAKSAKPLPEPVRGEIEFDRVWFAYQGKEWVLQDVSFTIKQGQTIAFVGATGAGKSSIIQLINRFYEIQKGAIRLDGTDIRDIPQTELRRAIGVVQQDVFLFNGDIASNIRLSSPDITDEQVRVAARMVRADAFIDKLPFGYASPLGERGITLSLGERQLLSFARAIAFRPPVLILDEATSNIDTETELVVQEALHTISKGRTTLIVAHRLSTIQHADQIIVMRKGRVQEIGSHFELLANRGYYYRLFEMQYRDQQQSPAAR